MGHPRWAQPTWARLGLQARRGGLYSPRSTLGASLAHWMSSGPNKIHKKFRCVWTSFGTDILRSKKQVKNSN